MRKNKVLPAAVKIREVCVEKNIELGDFAKVIGVTLRSLYRYMSGEAVPRKEIMDRIIEFTKSVIQPNDFYFIEG